MHYLNDHNVPSPHDLLIFRFYEVMDLRFYIRLREAPTYIDDGQQPIIAELEVAKEKEEKESKKARELVIDYFNQTAQQTNQAASAQAASSASTRGTRLAAVPEQRTSTRLSRSVTKTISFNEDLVYSDPIISSNRDRSPGHTGTSSPHH